MRAVVFEAAETVRVDDVPDPEVLGPQTRWFASHEPPSAARICTSSI